MSTPVDRARHLMHGLTLTAVLLLAALPVESAVQVVQPSPEAEKAASCTMASPSSDEERGTRDRAIPGPRVAAGEPAPEGKPAPRHDPTHVEVCPLHLEQEPGPPRARP